MFYKRQVLPFFNRCLYFVSYTLDMVSLKQINRDTWNIKNWISRWVPKVQNLYSKCAVYNAGVSIYNSVLSDSSFIIYLYGGKNIDNDCMLHLFYILPYTSYTLLDKPLPKILEKTFFIQKAFATHWVWDQKISESIQAPKFEKIAFFFQCDCEKSTEHIVTSLLVNPGSGRDLEPWLPFFCILSYKLDSSGLKQLAHFVFYNNQGSIGTFIGSDCVLLKQFWACMFSGAFFIANPT